MKPNFADNWIFKKTAVVIGILCIAFNSEAAKFRCLKLNKGFDNYCIRDPLNDVSCSENFYAWTSSCQENRTNVDVLKLVGKTEIPLSEFKKDKLLTIAQSIVQRRFQKFEREKIVIKAQSQKPCDVEHFMRPMIAFSGHIIGKIIKNGFLNQFQTHTSSGTFDLLSREKIESDLIGISLPHDLSNELINLVRPKYGYALFLEKCGNITPVFNGDYGEVFAVFKKEVNSRTLVVNEDSLDHFKSGQPKIAASKFTVSTLYGLALDQNLPLRGNYYESVTLGPLDLNDVEYLLVNCPDKSQIDLERFISEIRSLKLKVPVYQCIEDGKTVGLTFRFSKGAKLN